MKIEARNLGLVLDTETISNADKLGDSIDALKASFSSAKNNLVSEFAPALIAFTDQMKKQIDATIAYRKEWEAFKKSGMGTAQTLDELSNAIKGSITYQKELQNVLDTSTSLTKKQREELEALIEQTRLREQALRAEAIAIASSNAANKLGTDAAQKQARIDADNLAKAEAAAKLAEIRLEKLREEREAVDALNASEFELFNARIQGEQTQLEKIAEIKAANEDAFQSYIQAWDEGDSIDEDMHQNRMDRIEKEKAARVQAMMYAYGQINAIIDQMTENEIANIEASGKSEEEKADLIKKAKHKQAVWDKAQALVEIAINTSTAVVKALPNLILAGIVGGLGLVQAGMVAAQKIPSLAEGGVVMPSEGGTLAQIAEAGQPEAVIPLDRMGDFGGTTHLVVNLDSRPLLDKIFEATRNQTVLISAGAIV